MTIQASILIQKDGPLNFNHVCASPNTSYRISRFSVDINDELFRVKELSGAVKTPCAWDDITVQDNTVGGGVETFGSKAELFDRLVELGYNAFFEPVVSINGLIEQGSNVTITGSGTIADPYIISSSGGGSGSVNTVNSISPTAGNIDVSLNSVVAIDGEVVDQSIGLSSTANNSRIQLDGVNSEISIIDDDDYTLLLTKNSIAVSKSGDYTLIEFEDPTGTGTVIFSDVGAATKHIAYLEDIPSGNASGDGIDITGGVIDVTDLMADSLTTQNKVKAGMLGTTPVYIGAMGDEGGVFDTNSDRIIATYNNNTQIFTFCNAEWTYDISTSEFRILDKLVVTEGVDDPTTVALTTSDLNTAYPTAKTGFKVYCKDIITGEIIYEKTATSGVWLGVVAFIP